MTAATDTHGEHGDHAGEHIHPPMYYVKIWAILVVLMFLSLLGSEVPNHLVVLMAAFGIAIVKAYFVCAKFMHLNIEKKFVVYFLVTSLAFLALFYFGVSPDVMEHKGHRWKNVAAEAAVNRGLEAAKHAPHGEGAHE